MVAVLWQACCLGLIAGVAGSLLGAFLSLMLKRVSKRLMGGMLMLSSGVMTAVVCFDLLPEAISVGNIWMGLGGVVAGVALVLFIDALTKKRVPADGMTHMGVLVALGIAAHNLPEGMAIGAGFVHSPAFGIGLCVLIALHDIPEGLAMGIPLNKSGMQFIRLLAVCLAVGLPSALGAFIGAAMAVNPMLISISLGMASGAMLYIACGELIPGAGDVHRGRMNGVFWVLGFLLGVFVCVYLV